jgi:ribonuclease HI
MKKILKVYTDGASRGNPGLAGIGIAVMDSEDKIIKTDKKFLGTFTNNSAEYTALIESVKSLRSLEIDYDEINFFLDSELVVKQIKGQYKIKHQDLIKLSLKFWNDIKLLGKDFTITHIRRENNKIADKLANEAIDERNQ